MNNTKNSVSQRNGNGRANSFTTSSTGLTFGPFLETLSKSISELGRKFGQAIFKHRYIFIITYNFNVKINNCYINYQRWRKTSLTVSHPRSSFSNTVVFFHLVLYVCVPCNQRPYLINNLISYFNERICVCKCIALE